MRKNKLFHPCHVQLVQERDDADFIPRFQFRKWALRKVEEQEQRFPELRSVYSYFIKTALFQDAATTTILKVLTGCARSLDHQHRWSLKAWGPIIKPHFFDENLNSKWR